MKNMLIIFVAIFAVNLTSAQEKKLDTRTTEQRTKVTTTTTQKRKVPTQAQDSVYVGDKKQYQTRTATDGTLTDDTAPGVHDPNNTGSVTPRTTDPAPAPNPPVPVQPGTVGSPSGTAPPGGNVTSPR
jgi:hypothetical protein